METFWRKCSSCKAQLPYSGKHWACNVSTCNRSRTFLAFCSVSCWDAHLGMARHRESWAEEKSSPTKDFWQKVLEGTELWPPREAKPVVVPESKPVSSGPKVILRKK